MSDKDADEVEQHMNWNAIAEGLKPHEDIHGVVVIMDLTKLKSGLLGFVIILQSSSTSNYLTNYTSII